MSFAQGVMQGQSIFEQYNKQFTQGQQKRDLVEVAKAEATESTGFTADQGKQLEGYVQQGFDNVSFDDKTNAYLAKNAAGETKTVAMQGVTDFMGKRTAGGADAARASAYADVIGKTGVFDKRVSYLVKARRKIQASDNPNKRDLVKEINKEIEGSMYRLNKAVEETLALQR